MFINSGVADVDRMVEDLLQNSSEERRFDGVLLNERTDGVAQITGALQGHGQEQYDAIHIISHGSSAGVRIGGTWLTSERFETHAAQIGQWRDAMSANAGLLIDASNSTIHSLSIVGWNDDGLQIQSGNTNNFVLGNYIGLRPDGTTILANDDNGIDIGGDNHTIGGTAAGERNVISGNTSDGIELELSGANNNTIIGNYIGTDAGGTVAKPNRSGIRIMSGAHTNTIGGTSAAERNVSSGNSDHGLDIEDAGTDSNVVLGNFIGVNKDGDTSLANGLEGIYIQNGAQNNIIGGTAAGSGNVISGNDVSRVRIDNSGTDGNQLLGNFIGTDLGGSIDLGNVASGVRVEDLASDNIIGSTAAATRLRSMTKTVSGSWTAQTTATRFVATRSSPMISWVSIWTAMESAPTT